MHRRGLIASAVLAASGSPGVGASLDDVLRPYLARFSLPALAAAVVRDGAVVASGAVGTRRMGADAPVTLGDRFHIGSDTKAMTALLAGMEVERGTLDWGSMAGEVLPEVAGGLGRVTLAQLLSHTSGIPGDNEAFGKVLFGSLGQGGMNLDELRLWMVQQWGGEVSTGGQFAYANMNYVIAGAMLERVTRRTWEELVVERIFAPLGLQSAGFGPQASLGRVDAPLGHAVGRDGTLKPMLAGPDGDNPAVLGPAGTVHLSILDFAAWAIWNAAEGRRGPGLARAETVRKLHTPAVTMPGGAYAMGWVVVELPYAPGKVLTHSGSNTLNFATIILQPAQEFGMVLATNVGGGNADHALRAAAEGLYRKFAAL